MGEHMQMIRAFWLAIHRIQYRQYFLILISESDSETVELQDNNTEESRKLFVGIYKKIEEQNLLLKIKKRGKVCENSQNWKDIKTFFKLQ